MALRLCYVSGEVFMELTLGEKDTVEEVKGLANEQLPLGTSVIALLLGKENLAETCSLKSLCDSEVLELVAVTGPQQPLSYVTLDNGGTPFLVRILSRGSQNSVTVCVRKQEVMADASGAGETELLQYACGLHDFDISSPLLDVSVDAVFIGRSPLNEMTRRSGGHGPGFDGNSILLKRHKDYVFIGHEIFSFTPAADIVDFVSPVGNSSVPYPYAVDADGRHYLLIEGVVMDEQIDGDPYSAWYEHNGDKCDFQLFCNGAQLRLHTALGFQRLQEQHPLCRAPAVYTESASGSSKDIPMERFLERVQSMLSMNGVSLLQRLETLCPRQ